MKKNKQPIVKYTEIYNGSSGGSIIIDGVEYQIDAELDYGGCYYEGDEPSVNIIVLKKET